MLVRAVALVLLGVGLSWLFRSSEPGGGFGAQEVVTASGETSTVILRDGSVVRLAPQSRLRVGADDSERRVSLTGRAYFAVARNPGRPFRIDTPSGEVEVLGTRFDLDAASSDLKVTVVEGTVVLEVEGKEERLEAGEIGQVVRGTLLPPRAIADGAASTSWVGNFLAFQSTPLHDVVPEIERIFGVEVAIEDAALAERTVTIHFVDWSLTDVMDALCLLVQARCTTEQGVISMRLP